MKKFLAFAAAAVVALGAAAQNMYIGGSVGFQQTKQADDKTTTIDSMPEIGYNLSDSWAIGTTAGVDYSKTGDRKFTLVAFTPYARYTFLRSGIVSVFCDGGVDLGFGKASVGGESSKTAVAYGIGIKPGLSLTVNDKFGFVAHVGFFGYNGANKAAKDGGYPTVAGFNLNGNDLSVGFYYNF